MSGQDNYDNILLSILQQEGQIIPFLDVFFGFLQRRTDFYIVKKNCDATIGFPPGVAEKTVLAIFRKWQKVASRVAFQDNISLMEGDMTDMVIHEEEVVTSDSPLGSGLQEEVVLQPQSALKKSAEDDLSSDTYNGANCGSYRWSQTYLEVDIKVPVPSNVAKSSQVRVDIQTGQLSVSVKDHDDLWTTLMCGELANKHLKEESIWTLSPGKHISIHLQKAKEKWWDCLLCSETKLDLTRLDVSKHVTDLPDEDHMQVERVLLEEERKRLGLAPVRHQEQLDKLKEAWDLEGSPFRGTPFDPSVLQLPP